MKIKLFPWLFFFFFASPAHSSPLSDLGTGGIRFYQTFISSQDGDNCPMRPSCSQFGYQALRRYGFFQGSLMTADRLVRDNPWSKKDYPLIGQDKVFYLSDPVEGHVLSLSKDLRGPLFAGTLSLLVPGGGQFYQGHRGDALAAFLVAGTLDFAGLYYLNRRSPALGVSFLSLGGLFQAGSIYGAMVEAQKKMSE